MSDNRELGVLLLAAWIKAKADDMGVKPDAQFAERLRLATVDIEGSYEHAGLAQALRKAARGDFESAGADIHKLFIKEVGELTLELLNEQLGIKARKLAKELEVTKEHLDTVIPMAHGYADIKKQRKEWAQEGANTMRENAEPNRANILKAGETILTTWPTDTPLNDSELTRQIVRNLYPEEERKSKERQTRRVVGQLRAKGHLQGK